MIYFVLVAGLCWSSYRDPSPTFDRYLYAATVASQSTTDAGSIARAAVAQGDWGYKRWWFTDDLLSHPLHLVQQIPFYSIRPLYISALRLFGLKVVSPLALGVIAVVLLLWLRSPFWAGVVVLVRPLYDVAHTITPDALAAAFLLCGSFLLFRKKDAAGIVVLLCSVWVRTDCVIYIMLCLAWLWREERLRIDQAAVLGVIAVASVMAINHFSGNYGFRLLVHHAFVGPLPAPAEHPEYAGFRDYLSALYHGVRGLLVVASIWFLAGCAGWKLNPSMRPLLAVAGLYLLLHVGIYPLVDERYLVAAYVVAAVALADGLRARIANPRAFGAHV